MPAVSTKGQPHKSADHNLKTTGPPACMWEVQWEGKKCRVLAGEPYVALQRALKRGFGIRYKADREAEIDSGAAQCVRVYPFTASGTQHPYPVRSFYAASIDEAMQIVQEEPFRGHAVVTPCDDWFALHELEDRELVFLGWALWPGSKWRKHEHSMLSFMCQAIADSNVPKLKKRGYTLSNRTRKQVIHGLRLSMLLPFLSQTRIDETRHTKSLPSGPAERTRKSALQTQWEKLHMDNLGHSLSKRLMEAMGPELHAFDPARLALICEFIEAYGYNPDEMLWAEVMALWHEGFEGLERRKIDWSIGMYDIFRDELRGFRKISGKSRGSSTQGRD